MRKESQERASLPRFFTLEMFMFTITVLSGLVLIWNLIAPNNNIIALFCAGIVFTLSIVCLLYTSPSPRDA